MKVHLSMVCAGIFLLIILLAQVEAAQPSLRVIASGAFSGVQEPVELVITNKTGWDALWKKHSARKTPETPAPEVDFTKETVLFVALGRKNTGGYAISIKDVEVQEGRYVAKVASKSPAPGALAIQALTSPFFIGAIPAPRASVVFQPSSQPEAARKAKPALNQPDKSRPIPPAGNVPGSAPDS